MYWKRLTIGLTSLLGFTSASEWNAQNGQLSILTRGTIVESKEFSELGNSPVFVPSQSTLEINFESHKDSKGSKAHQTFAVLSDEKTGLQFSFPASNVKPNGKAKITIPQKHVPSALQGSDDGLTLSILLGSFDNTAAAKILVSSNVYIEQSPGVAYSKPTRLQVKEEIKHIFKDDPARVAAPIALFFVGGAFTLLAIILLFWLSAGPNLKELGTALQGSFVGHLGLIGSLFAYELVFILYYKGQSIFDTLAALAVITPVALFTGSRALSEVKTRREQGRF